MESPKTASDDQLVERKPYRSPLLIQYGAIQDLTKDGIGSGDVDVYDEDLEWNSQANRFGW